MNIYYFTANKVRSVVVRLTTNKVSGASNVRLTFSAIHTGINIMYMITFRYDFYDSGINVYFYVTNVTIPRKYRCTLTCWVTSDVPRC